MKREHAIALLKALGVPVRVVVLQRVARRPSTATELARQLPVSRPAVVQHLGVLRRMGLVEVSTRGRDRVYRVRAAGFDPLVDWVRRCRGPGAEA